MQALCLRPSMSSMFDTLRTTFNQEDAQLYTMDRKQGVTGWVNTLMDESQTRPERRHLQPS